MSIQLQLLFKKAHILVSASSKYLLWSGIWVLYKRWTEISNGNFFIKLTPRKCKSDAAYLQKSRIFFLILISVLFKIANLRLIMPRKISGGSLPSQSNQALIISIKAFILTHLFKPLNWKYKNTVTCINNHHFCYLLYEGECHLK